MFGHGLNKITKYYTLVQMYKMKLCLGLKGFGVRCDLRHIYKQIPSLLCFLVVGDEYKTLTLKGVQHS